MGQNRFLKSPWKDNHGRAHSIAACMMSNQNDGTRIGSCSPFILFNSLSKYVFVKLF